MARPFFKNYAPAAVDTDGLVDGGSGASLTLLASGAGDGLAHQLNFTSGANISDHTFLVTGTDENGTAQTETVTGPDATTVESTKYFLTVTSIVPNATLDADEVDIGWVDEFVTPTIPLDWRGSQKSVRVVVTGTINYTAQQTFSKMAVLALNESFEWSDSTDADLVSATTTQISVFDKPVTGFRLKANSYSSSAELDLYIVEADR